MPNHMHDSVSYLRACKKAAEHKPHLHRMTIKAYDHYLAIAETEPENYLQKAGDMFLNMKSEQLDRQANFFDLYKKLQYKERQQAHKHMYDILKEAKGYADINSKTREAQQQTEAMLNKENEKKNTLLDFILAVISQHVGIDIDKAGFKNTAIEKWTLLQGLDPEISWKKIKTFPPYRNCLYYDDERLDLLEKWWKEDIA